MYGIKALLTLGLLLTAADARPEGYGGVKGGRNNKSTANAFASAQATAHADGGYPGMAQSSAIATANAFSSGGTSNAAATANAYADGGNIGKAIESDDANGNANPLGDSDNLRLSSVHGKDSKNQSHNQKDGTSVENHHNAKTGAYGNDGSVGVTGQSQDRRGGCVVPAGVKGHRSASGCTHRNVGEENEPSVSNPSPASNGYPDLSAGSKHPSSLNGGYGGNNAGHEPSSFGAPDCPKNKPSVSNAHPAYDENPNSKYPSSLNGENGSNNAQPCGPGAAGCPKSKPSVSNPHPTYNGNPDLSAGSKYPTILDGGFGGNNRKPEPPEPPKCSTGAAECPENEPSVSNPHAVHPGYVDSTPDPQRAVDMSHGHVEGHTGKPQHTPCFPGDPRCLAGSKPKHTTPDPSTTGTIQSGPIPCTSGSINCPNAKPGGANLHPTRQQNPDSSGSERYPNFNGGYESKIPIAGENPSSGSSQYPGSSRKPDTSNPFLNGEIDVSDIKDAVNTGVGFGTKTNPANPFLNPHSQVRPSTGTKQPEKPTGSYGGSPTAPGYHHGGSSDSALPTIKPNPSNPFLSHNGNVDSVNHVQHPQVSTQGNPLTIGGCYGSTSCESKKPGHPTGSSEYPVAKPNPSNPFLSHDGNRDSTYSVNHPGTSGNPQISNSPPTQGNPPTIGGCYGSTSCDSKKPGHPTGSSEYPVAKPNPSNPFLSHDGNRDSTYSVNHPGTSANPQISNSPHTQGNPPTIGGDAEKTTGTKYPVLKNPATFGESSHDRTNPHSSVNENYGSQDAPSVYPVKESTGSNLYLGDGQLTNPHPGLHGTANSPQPFPGHDNAETSATEREPEVGNGHHRNGNPYGTDSQGAKTHQAGVKGGPRRREPPAKFQETELLSGNTGSAYSTAHASASASAHSSAYASSSSSSGGAQSSAKSDAYGDLGNSGWSNSWASSSASATASASAFASGSSHQGPENWRFPDVPAE